MRVLAICHQRLGPQGPGTAVRAVVAAGLRPVRGAEMPSWATMASCHAASWPDSAWASGEFVRDAIAV